MGKRQQPGAGTLKRLASKAPPLDPEALLAQIRAAGGVKRKKGDLVTGTITGVYEYGVVIDNPSERMRGMLHASKLGHDPWGMRRNAEEVLSQLKVGDEITARIINEPKHTTIGAAQFGGEKLELSVDDLPLPSDVPRDPEPMEGSIAERVGQAIASEVQDKLVPEQSEEPQDARELPEEQEPAPPEPVAEPPRKTRATRKKKASGPEVRWASAQEMLESAEGVVFGMAFVRDFLHKVEAAMYRAMEAEKTLNAVYDDLTHAVELGDFKPSEAARIMARLKESRQERRKHKDFVMVVKPIIDMLNKEPGMLSYVHAAHLRVMRKGEEMGTRGYTPKALKDMRELFERAGIRIWEEGAPTSED